MSVVDIAIDMGEIRAMAGELENAHVAIGDEIRQTVQVSLDHFEQAIVVRVPVGVSGNLRGSVATDIYGEPLGQLYGEVFTPLIYGWPVEKGRKPGKFPPLGPIALWLYRKGIVTDRKEIRSAAYLVARSIAEGTSRHQREGGAKAFEMGFEDALPAVELYWDKLPDRILARLVQ